MRRTLTLLIGLSLGISAGLPLWLVPACSPEEEAADMAQPDLAPPAYSCDQRMTSGPYCREFTEVAATQSTDDFDKLCGGHLGPGLCPRTDSLGACRTLTGTYTLSIWYFSDTSLYTTTAQVQAACAKLGAAYVAPQ